MSETRAAYVVELCRDCAHCVNGTCTETRSAWAGWPVERKCLGCYFWEQREAGQ